MKTEIILEGRPITKKNSQVIVDAVSKTGRRYKRPIPSKQYRLYEESCLWQLKTYRGPTFESTWLSMTVHYYMPNKRAWPDLLGLLQATCDILEAGKVIDNDKWIKDFGDSRIVGIDKDNPRTVIRIEETEEAK